MATKQNVPTPGIKKKLLAKTGARRKKQADLTAIEAEAGKMPRNDLQPKLVMERRPIASLRPAGRQVRKSNAGQLGRIIAAINNFGVVAPILVDRDSEIIDGHIVLEAMGKLGLEEVDCIVVDHLTKAEIRALRLSYNRVAETGEWDLDALRLELIELETLNIDLATTSFTLPEIDILLMDPCEDDPEADGEQDVIVATGDPITRHGDLFALGDHRLLCGDSLEAGSYDALLEGQPAQCVFSDPPYNCPIKGFVGGLGRHKHDNFAMAVGEKSDEEFLDFLLASLVRCRDAVSAGAVIFACMDFRQVDILLVAGRLAGLHRLNVAVWNKGSGGMGSLYRSAHELVAVFCTAPTPRVNNIDLGRHGRDRTNVWTYPGANRQGSSAAEALAIHPTPKPLPLVADALLDFTRKGDIVLDPFMGSGSTIMAAQQTGRRARGIEYDPRYVDAAIRRWERKTGREAVHVGSGMTFAELTMDRTATGSNAGEAALPDSEHGE